MSEDLQGLLEKINREGVEKAEAKAAEIIAEAKAKAAEIVKAAKDEAAQAKADADAAAQDFAARAAETIRQAARDTVISVRESIVKLLEKVLAENVNSALLDGTTAASLVASAVSELAGGVEISAAPQIAESLKSQLAAKGEISVLADSALSAGFSVKVDNGRIEHAFTPEVIAAELAKRLRPELANLLK
ncbi:MAG: hypothetical protein IKV56_02000 [Kiritimatiellae bacterium]|nr:hypothetical protein [Kiritimatiellia bacterium]